MTEKIKDRLLHEARYAENIMRYMWRAYYAAKYDDINRCIGILKSLHDTTADARVLKLIEEVRKEQK